MEEIKKQPFFENNNKRKYFDLLPENAILKKKYNQLLKMKPARKEMPLKKI